jgi:hypothetical protein
MILGILFYQKRKNKGSYFSHDGLYVYLSACCAFANVNNFGREQKAAIISSDNAYLMDGPSPGADVIVVVAFLWTSGKNTRSSRRMGGNIIGMIKVRTSRSST